MTTCDETNNCNQLPKLTSIASITSLHARKWASIGRRGTLSIESEDRSNHNGSIVSESVNNQSPPNNESSNRDDSGNVELSTELDVSDSEMELSSRSKRKLSRDPFHNVVEGAARTIGDFMATTILTSDNEAKSSICSHSQPLQLNGHPKRNVSTDLCFQRRDTRQIAGPNGEKFNVQKKDSSPADNIKSRCLLDFGATDNEIDGFIDNVLSTSEIAPSDSENKQLPESRVLQTSGFSDNLLHNTTYTLDTFPDPIMCSTMLQLKEEEEEEEEEDPDDVSLDDSSDTSPSVTGESTHLRHLSFVSQDLPLCDNNVAPIPRIVVLQHNDEAKGTASNLSIGDLNDGTTTYTDSEDLYSSHHSSQADMANSILQPIHTRHVKKTLLKEEPDFEELERYFPTHQMSLFVGTWNMHSDKDVPLLVEEFLMPPECEFVQDIYVIGTQECTPHKREWEVTVQATLGPTHVLVRSESLGDIHLIILVRREMIWIMRDIQSSTVACGAGGVMRNKGAVGIVLTIFGSSILFITSHLRAHINKVKERNLDASRIATSLDFSRYCKITTNGKPDTQNITDRVDNVFWMGDLNYRVTADRSFVDNCLHRQNFEPLLKEDQLLQQIQSKEAFQAFVEAPINFPPTFKFDPGTSDYDTSPKQRVPSWTDRILYKSKHDSITPQIYHYCPGLTSSDHRPVFGVYLVMLKPSPISATIRATGWFDKRAYARGMKKRRLFSLGKHPSKHKLTSTLTKQPSIIKVVNYPFKNKDTVGSNKKSAVCTVM